MRVDPDPTGAERVLLGQYLDYQRETVLGKTEGLDRARMAQQLPPSTLTLGGLLYHLALVEEGWMEVHFLGLPEREPWVGVDWETDRDWEFHAAAGVDPEELRRRYREACERSRQAAAGARDLDQLAVKTLSNGRHASLRWILMHLVEETARHAGHADLLREAIDGSVGE
ncbi:MAG: DinB family protein [Candidatus Dormibacteraceae bacterium]